jgi:electron transfer flavoprotein alpha subunit
MELAVFAKVVPDLEDPAFEIRGGHARRDGIALFLNPFDQRALRIALDLRGPADRVGVYSMGPPSAVPALQEALALGADKVVLVCDPDLAGADTLATARVLARVLERSKADLALFGARSTDGETGQVVAEVAALTERPWLGPARTLERGEAPGTWRVTFDTETGWASGLLNAPALLSVGEKAAKLRHPTDAERVAAAARTVERWDRATLALAPEAVGALGSPTRVARVRPDRTRRLGLLLTEGTLAERVDRAVTLYRTRPRPASVPSAHGASSAGVGAFALVTGADGELDERSLALLSEARRAAPAGPVAALWIGSAPAEPERRRLGQAGATDLLLAEPADGWGGAAVSARTIEARLSAAHPFDLGLFLSADHGREVAARVAARLGYGLTADAIELLPEPDGTIVWSKPAFQGRALAEIVSRSRPSLATVRPGVFAPGDFPTDGTLREERLTIPPGPPGPLIDTHGAEPLDGFGDLDRARVVVSLGKGIGGPEGVRDVLGVIDGTGWAVGASRRVVDEGWVPRRLQVGLTGRSLAPELAILLGVRGSTNHLIGWRRAGYLVAVNSDPGAAVFAGCDAGLVDRWEEALPALVQALRDERSPGER